MAQQSGTASSMARELGNHFRTFAGLVDHHARAMARSLPAASGMAYLGTRMHRGDPKNWALGTRKLKLDLDPLQRCYLHHAHLFGILGSFPELSNFPLNHFINVQLVGANLSLLEQGKWVGFLEYDPYLCFETLPTVTDLKLHRWTEAECREQSSLEFAKRAWRSIEQGHYLELNLNEFFVEGTNAGFRRDARHHALIFGFDNEQCCFLCASYLKGAVYGVGRISADLLKDAVFSQIGQRKPAAGDYCSDFFVQEISLGSQLCQELNPVSIYRQVSSFLESRRCAWFWNQDVASDTRFGRSSYEIVLGYLVACEKNGAEVDLHVTRFFWERQRLMKVRVKELLTRRMLRPRPQLLDQWGESERRFHRVHLLALEQAKGGAKMRRSAGIATAFQVAIDNENRLQESLRRALESSGFACANDGGLSSVACS